MESLSDAIARLNLHAITALHGTLVLDRDTLNAQIHILSESIIRSFVKGVMSGQVLNLQVCIEYARKYYAALKGVACNIAALNSSLDFSPWHVFDLRLKMWGEMLYDLPYSDPTFNQDKRNKMERATALGMYVVLSALPHLDIAEKRRNAFMRERNGVSPLMHAIENRFDPKIVRVLFERGGGFSSSEWEGGAVTALLFRGNIRELVENLLKFCRSDILHRINQRDSEGNTVLLAYCRHFESIFYVFNDIQILVETLGADPGSVNNAGDNALQLLFQRWDKDPLWFSRDHMNMNIKNAIDYLAARAPNATHPQPI
jgi:hypothetical protein